MITINVLVSGRLKLDGYGRGKPEGGDGTFLLALPEKSKVQQAIRGMGVPSNKVAMTMLNGRNCERETKLKTGDRVILIPTDVAALWQYLGAMNMNRETVLDC
jgi:molybdopterin converting factor small subunit